MAMAAQPVPDMLDTRAVMSVSIGPIPLAAGEEKTVCTVFKLGNTSAIDVTQFAATLAPGSHHLIFYKSVDTTEMKDPFVCNPLDISKGNVPYFIAQTANNNTLPVPAGAAFHIEAGQMVRLEAHYLNASANPIMGLGTVNLSLGAAGVTYQPADIMFCGTVIPLLKGAGTGVPPGHTVLPHDFFVPPDGIKVFGLTTHEHSRGSLMTIDKANGPMDPNAVNLTMGKPYDNPPFRVWKDPDLITFGKDSGGFATGLRWQCTYDNPTTTTYYWGESAATGEMCFLWAYYYPSVGHFIAQECQR